MLLLELKTLSDTHTHTHIHLAGLLWTSDRLVAGITSTWQHTTQ